MILNSENEKWQLLKKSCNGDVIQIYITLHYTTTKFTKDTKSLYQHHFVVFVTLMVNKFFIGKLQKMAVQESQKNCTAITADQLHIPSIFSPHLGHFPSFSRFSIMLKPYLAIISSPHAGQ